MAVAYDNVETKVGNSVTSLTTNSFTITASSNRVAILGLHFPGTTYSSLSMSCGGQSGSQIASVATIVTVELWGVINPASGSQTASASWTGANDAVLGAMTFSGAAQSSVFTDPQTSGGYGSSNNISISSDNGDMTVSVLTSVTTDWSTDQTIEYDDNPATPNVFGQGDIGPGTGNATHTWTKGSGSGWAQLAGCNIELAAGGALYTLNSIGALHSQVAITPNNMVRFMMNPLACIFNQVLVKPSGLLQRTLNSLDTIHMVVSKNADLIRTRMLNTINTLHSHITKTIELHPNRFMTGINAIHKYVTGKPPILLKRILNALKTIHKPIVSVVSVSLPGIILNAINSLHMHVIGRGTLKLHRIINSLKSIHKQIISKGAISIVGAIVLAAINAIHKHVTSKGVIRLIRLINSSKIMHKQIVAKSDILRNLGISIKNGTITQCVTVTDILRNRLLVGRANIISHVSPKANIARILLLNAVNGIQKQVIKIPSLVIITIKLVVGVMNFTAKNTNHYFQTIKSKSIVSTRNIYHYFRGKEQE